MTNRSTERFHPPVQTPAVKYGGWTGPVVMLIATLISYIDRQTLSQLAPMILADTHLTAAAFGDALSAFSIAYMLANPLWGAVLDHIGLRKGLAIAVAIWTVASMSHAVVIGFLGFAIARTILGIGEGAVFPACMKMATDCLPPERRSIGVGMGYSGAPIGSLITPLLVTPFALAYGWRAAFWITGALGAAWLCWWYFVSRPPIVPATERKKTKVVLPSLLDRRFWLIVTTYGIGAVAIGVIAYMSPLYLNRAMGLSQKELGYITWIPTLGWLIGYYVWGWVSDKILKENPRPVWFVLMLSALALPVALVGQMTTWPAVIAMFTWSIFIADGFIMTGLHVGGRVFPRDQAGMAAGIGGGSWSAVLAIVLPFYGRWIDAQLFERIFVTMSLLPLFGTLLFLMLSKPWANWREKQLAI